jgi:hypothetical protein
MTKWYAATMHHVIAAYNNMFDQMAGIMYALATKQTQWQEDL